MTNDVVASLLGLEAQMSELDRPALRHPLLRGVNIFRFGHSSWSTVGYNTMAKGREPWIMVTASNPYFAVVLSSIDTGGEKDGSKYHL